MYPLPGLVCHTYPDLVWVVIFPPRTGLTCEQTRSVGVPLVCVGGPGLSAYRWSVSVDLVCRRTAGLCRRPAGLCRRPAGLCRRPAGLCRRPAGLCRRPAGLVCRRPAGLCRPGASPAAGLSGRVCSCRRYSAAGRINKRCRAVAGARRRRLLPRTSASFQTYRSRPARAASGPLSTPPRLRGPAHGGHGGGGGAAAGARGRQSVSS